MSNVTKKVPEPKLHLETGGIKAYYLDTANKEYPVTISAGTRQFMLQARGDSSTLLVCLEKGGLGGSDTTLKDTSLGRYFTLKPNRVLVWTLSNPIKDVGVDGYGGIRLYVSCDVAGETVELWEWD